MRLVESFLSIQGEGAAAGRLAIFVRFFGCNLSCTGFGVSERLPSGEQALGCDTVRAVNRAFSYDKVSAKDVLLYLINLIDKGANLAQNTSENELASALFKLCVKRLYKAPIIVITGGEPLINHQNSEFVSLISALINANFSVHFETNASILVDFVRYPIYKSCEFAMSVKLSNSGESKLRRVKQDAILAILNNAKDCFFKFVLRANTDELAEISEILALAEKSAKKADVWLMPLGANKIELERSAIAVAKAAIKLGYNYTDRLHIRLWNDKEGV